MKRYALLLCGGKSTRMGSDKGLIIYKGKPMVQHAIDHLQSKDFEILLLTGNPAYARFSLPMRADEIPNLGPIGALYTGMLHTQSELLCVLACDMPDSDPSIFSHLLEHLGDADAIVPSFEGRMQPLMGLYRRSLLPQVEAQIAAKNYCMQDFCSSIDCSIIDLTEHPEFGQAANFHNVNSPKDLAQ